jgi:hypothetical protein
MDWTPKEVFQQDGIEEVIQSYVSHPETVEVLETEFKRLEEQNKQLMEFVRDGHKNWDCDSDAHKYNTPCRVCEAEKLYKQLGGED